MMFTSQILTNSDFKRLRTQAEARRRELQETLDAANKELAAIEEFLGRLKATEKLLLGSQAEGAGQSEDNPHSSLKRLSLAEMVGEVLRSESRKTPRQNGLKPLEISSEIKRRFNEDVSPRAVNSHVWYLFSRGRLEKVGTRYSISTDG